MSSAGQEGGPGSGGRRITALTVLVLLGLLAATAATMYWGWREIGAVEISRHGLIALGLGIGLSLLVGAGLMTLVFFSDRRGYDDRAHEWTRRGAHDGRRDERNDDGDG